MGLNNYRVKIGDNKKLFHINMMKNYHTRDVDHDMALASIVLEPSESESGEDNPISNDEETVSDVVLNPCFSPDQTRELQNLMNEFPTIFSSTPGRTSLLTHSIEVTSKEPIKRKPYPIPLSKLGVVKEEVYKMKELGIIEHSRSPYSSPLLLVRKSDSSYRPVIDFRRLNKITVFDAERMPNPEIIFAKIGQDKFLSKLDFCKGYWQIPIKIEDKENTAFCAPQGLFHFKVMPFGLVNAGAS